MSAFIFVLVPNKEAEEDIQDWQNGRQRKGKEAYEVLMNLFASGPGKGITRALGLRCLKKVKSSDKLYIYAHSAVGRGIGANRDDGTRKIYSSSELADILESEGLRKDFRDLRLYGCQTGMGSAQLGIEPFAQQLKDELVARGYHHIVVAGYLGNVIPAYFRRQTADGSLTAEEHKGASSRGTFLLRSSDLRREF